MSGGGGLGISLERQPADQITELVFIPFKVADRRKPAPAARPAAR
jgi:hypothetical protein